MAPYTPQSAELPNMYEAMVPYLLGGLKPYELVLPYLLRNLKKTPHGELTERQLVMLMLLGSKLQGRWTVQNMSRYMNRSKPVVTRAMDRLCKLGYAARTQDENDGRVVILGITQEGLDYLEC